MKSSGGATDEEKTALICRRSAADIFLLTGVWGSRPRQGIYRRSAAHESH